MLMTEVGRGARQGAPPARVSRGPSSGATAGLNLNGACGATHFTTQRTRSRRTTTARSSYPSRRRARSPAWAGCYSRGNISGTGASSTLPRGLQPWGGSCCTSERLDQLRPGLGERSRTPAYTRGGYLPFCRGHNADLLLPEGEKLPRGTV